MSIYLRREHKIAAIFLGGALLYLVADAIITTDREKIERKLDDMAKAASQGQVEALLASLSPTYRHEGLTRQSLAALAETYFRNYGPTSIATLHREITVTGSLAIAETTIFARATHVAGRSRWRISFQKRGRDWEITRIDTLSIGGQETGSWRTVLRLLGSPDVSPFR